jgi:hypothetical protein
MSKLSHSNPNLDTDVYTEEEEIKKMKYKVQVIQYHVPVIVEAATKEEAELYAAEHTAWEPDFIHYDTEQIESDKDREIKVRFATEHAQMIMGH